MPRKTESLLSEILAHRAIGIGRTAEDCINHASEIAVFGSMAAGLEGPDSDIDILCIGDRDFKIKANLLDLIVISRETFKDLIWLRGELVSHIREYGVWIRGKPKWRVSDGIGKEAVSEKRRRVAAFMKYLPSSWPTLEDSFKKKYALKLRREAQRLILLERGVPIPPTKLLDTEWSTFSVGSGEIQDCLNRYSIYRHHGFVRSLLAGSDTSALGSATVTPTGNCEAPKLQIVDTSPIPRRP